MACCALAAFVVSQLLLALDFLRERVLGLTPALVPANANAAWRLGDAPLPRAARLPFAPPRRLALAVTGGALAFGVSYVSLHAGDAHRPHALAIPYLCTSSPPAVLD
jgi:hypothetical protein